MLRMLLLCLLLTMAASADPELDQRLKLAEVPGVQFRVLDGVAHPPEPIQPQPAYDINWASAPSKVVPVGSPSGQPLLQTLGGTPLLLRDGDTVVIAVDTTNLRRWPYFNYLLYCAASEVAGRKPLAYGDWPHSPVPHRSARIAYGCGAVLAWALFLIAYRRARTYADPDSHERFFGGIDLHSATSHATQRDQMWNKVGFARPLAGLLTLLASMSFMVGAYFLIQWVLSAKVQPFPEADGLWRTTWDTLLVFASLFEFGTNLSIQKYFAEHRALDKREALKDVQFYTWWALFQRLLQATLLIGMAVSVLPYSQYAIYAPFVTLFGIKGMPALFQLGKIVCAGLQRFDYLNLLDMLEQRLLMFLIPIPFVLVGRQWGVAHPQFGEAFGAALGLGIGHMASQVFMLFLGLYVLKRMGVPLDTLFMAQFDKGTMRRQLLFGGKIAIGSEPVFLLKSVESVTIVKMMPDFTKWLGIHQLLTGRLAWLFFFAQPFYGGAMPAISEAYSAGKRALTQYYVARYFQFGFLYQMTIFSLMMAVGPVFIRALGHQWEPAIPFLILSMLQGVFAAPAWISDSFQQGTGRPGTMLLVMLLEQGSRLLLFLALVPRLHFAGIFLATLGALAIKDVAGWWINHKTILPLRLSFHATLVAPGLAGLCNYSLWTLVVHWLPLQNSAHVLGLIAVASATSFFVTFFACGLAGGYDATALEEFHQAARMCTFLQPLARGMAACAQRGADLSPLKLRDLAWRDEAYAEAEQLDAVEHTGVAAPVGH